MKKLTKVQGAKWLTKKKKRVMCKGLVFSPPKVLYIMQQFHTLPRFIYVLQNK